MGILQNNAPYIHDILPDIPLYDLLCVDTHCADLAYLLHHTQNSPDNVLDSADGTKRRKYHLRIIPAHTIPDTGYNLQYLKYALLFQMGYTWHSRRAMSRDGHPCYDTNHLRHDGYQACLSYCV